MGQSERPREHPVELRVAQHHQRGEWSEAVTLGLETYGAEIYGFLVGTTQHEDEAAEVFAQFSLDLWAGIEGFRWSSSFRTWAYTLARNAWSRFLRDPYRRRASPLSAHPELSRLEQRIRSETAPFLRSESKTRAAELRRRLAPDDQALLILRIDKDLGWDEIAQIFSGDPSSSPGALRRASAALRKRFERIKEQLRALARAEKLIE